MMTVVERTGERERMIAEKEEERREEREEGVGVFREKERPTRDGLALLTFLDISRYSTIFIFIILRVAFYYSSAMH